MSNSGTAVESIHNQWKLPFWHSLAGSFLVTMIVVMILNLITDPFSIYGTGLLPRSEINHHEVKLDFFKRFDPPGEALILGNSQAMELDPDLLTELSGLRSFNFSLPGARTETFYSILKIVIEDYDWPIRTVIVSMSPGTFNPAMPVEQEARFQDEIAQNFVYDVENKANWLDRIALLFTLDQLKQSIKQIRGLIGRTIHKPRIVYRENGGSSWPERERRFVEGEIDVDFVLDWNLPQFVERRKLDQFDELSEIRVRYWEDFLAFCIDMDIELYIFMSPHHPRLLEYLSDHRYDYMFPVADRYVEESVAAAGGHFYNLRDVVTFNGDPDQFYDGVHMRPANADVVLEFMFGQEESDDIPVEAENPPATE